MRNAPVLFLTKRFRRENQQRSHNCCLNIKPEKRRVNGMIFTRLLRLLLLYYLLLELFLCLQYWVNISFFWFLILSNRWFLYWTGIHWQVSELMSRRDTFTLWFIVCFPNGTINNTMKQSTSLEFDLFPYDFFPGEFSVSFEDKLPRHYSTELNLNKI